MKPGELIPGDGPPPSAAATRRATARVRNTGRFPAYLGSHYPLARVSTALELDRDALAGARADLPSGATVRIDPGVEIELPVVWT
jgi:urease subunit beta